jgi:glycosyltransferase involved in cell wall biosynthesis
VRLLSRRNARRVTVKPSPDGISVCIVCRNEAEKLPACLESVGWADEIVVLDLASSDGSGEVARAHGARVVSRDPVPIVELVRNEVAAAATHDWILVLDPDERLASSLEPHLRDVVRRHGIDAAVIPRTNYDFGYPPSSPLHRYEPQLRLYRRSVVSWPTIPNALPAVAEERLHRVPYDDDLVIVHDRSRNIAEVLDRVVRYAPLQAQSMIERGEEFSARAMLENLGGRVYTQFIRGRAHRDGVPGVLRAGSLVAFHFYVWAAFWQLAGARRTTADDCYVDRVGRVVSAAWRASAVVRRPYRLVRGLRSRQS